MMKAGTKSFARLLTVACSILWCIGATPPLTAQADTDICATKQTDRQNHVALSVHGIRSDEGRVRIQIYGDSPENFLAKGKKLVRVEVPAKVGTVDACVPLPGLGDYSLVVMHDRNANGRADFYTEGFGFSNNPRLSIGVPNLSDTLFSAKTTVTELDVYLGYMLFGRLSPNDPRLHPDDVQQSSESEPDNGT